MAEPVPLVPGNINLYRQPMVLNPAERGISTVYAESQNIGGVEVLLPRVTPDGRLLSSDEAFAEYLRTGRHLGKFATPEDATAYSQRLHEEYKAGKYDLPGKKRTFINGVAIEPAVSHR